MIYALRFTNNGWWLRSLRSWRARLLLCFSILLSGTGEAAAQQVYHKAYGDSLQPALVFLHGGPGYSSASFEVTTARALADEGYYVIVYDRRGEGRSPGPANYDFAQTFADLDTLYDTYGLTSASLIGHSFGGVVATLYARAEPGRVADIVLVDAPLSVQRSLENILEESRRIYSTNRDSTNLRSLGLLEDMDTASLNYATYLLGHAGQNGFYRPAELTPKADSLYAEFAGHPAKVAANAGSPFLPGLGFWNNERFTTIDLSESLRQLKERGLLITGIYGAEDRLYPADQLHRLENILGEGNLFLIPGASHNPFIDRQSTFLEIITAY